MSETGTKNKTHAGAVQNAETQENPDVSSIQERMFGI